jgi:Zn-dependent peptidase ImmA (M78 family)
MLPSTLNIQGVKWLVKSVKDLADDHGRECHGLCSPADKTIFIRANDSESVQAESLIHESFHAICAQSGLWQTNTWNMDFEEILAEQLANFFVTNKAVISFPKRKKKK